MSSSLPLRFRRRLLSCAVIATCVATALASAVSSTSTYGQASINSKRPEPSRRSIDPRRTQDWKFIWKTDESRPIERIIINLTEQKVYAYQNGVIVMDTPCSTGSPSRPTPTGTWRVINKDADHHSGSYGYVVNANGQMINGDATPGSYVPPGGAYVRSPMPYFMRFVGGIGMHTGFLPGYAASHGCVRLPNEAARRLFAVTPVGTPVTVTR
ncbi:MAG: L,D-transpeptidase [Candidatus Methylacidiphilales bacterium]|nr:L,D-transpeptidase [Candidatus Methylacidiphilales bacterium]